VAKIFAQKISPTVAVGATMTINSYSGSYASTNPVGTAVVTIASANAAGVVSIAKSKVFVKASTAKGSMATGSDTVDSATGFTVANGAIGGLYIDLDDAYGGALTSGTLTVSATNGAIVKIASDYGTGSLDNNTSYTGAATYASVAQGTANTAVTTTVTLTVDGVSIGSKTLTFVGDLAKITVTPTINGKKGNTTDVTALYKAYDAAGNRLSLTPTLKGTDAVVSTGTITATSSSSSGTFAPTCSTYGTNAGLYLSATNAAGATIESPKFSQACAGDLYTYKAALDKSSYKQGEIATLTISTFDAYGKPANDITPLGTSTYKPAISGSFMTAVTAPTYGDVTTNGVITYQFVVGNTAGSYSMAVDLPYITSAASAAVSDTPKTVGYTIASDGSVSNAEVLAAIVKLIASINKQIAALQKALTKKK